MSITYDQREALHALHTGEHSHFHSLTDQGHSHAVTRATPVGLDMLDYLLKKQDEPQHSHNVAVGPQGMHTQGVPYWRFVQPWLEANGGALDTLIGLVERGPLADGDVPSKAGRNLLIEWRLAVRTVVNGEAGYQAATMDGVQAFCAMFGSNTLSEAIKARLEGK